MSCSIHTNYPLARSAPEGVKPTTRLRFNVTLAAEDRRIILCFEQEGCKEPQDHIVLDQDTLVEIVLHGDQLFFSHEFGAVTTKGEDFGFFYGGIEYDGYEEKLERYRVVRFVARFNRGGKYDTTHRFNIHADFLQNLGRSGPRWIGITIDPDIKNPGPIRHAT